MVTTPAVASAIRAALQALADTVLARRAGPAAEPATHPL
jgi:hypothetical protein